MTLVLWILFVTTGALIVAALVEAWLKHGRYLPPTKGRVDDKPDLGAEAIDMDHVRAALRTNNMASTLPGRHSASGRFSFMPSAPKQIIDDETYARRWFQAYKK